MLIGETATLTYICRKTAPAAINITAALRDVCFAAFPGRMTSEVAQLAEGFNLSLAPKEHLLHAGLANVNLILHPPGMILAAAWIEHTAGQFAYYYDAATPAVARVMERLDAERMAVAAAYGIVAQPFPALFAAIGSTTEAAARSGSYLQALRESAPNRHIQAPSSLDHRYLSEDIPYGLAPLADLAAGARVPVPVMDSLITLAGAVNQTDYRAAGRRLKEVGLEDMDPAAIVHRLVEGDSPPRR
ncbi:MAG TPA: NAD/NADP octopine/nopaline dehydrogenase family protein [Tepidisphaeraceae bacterium]|nr:NAD/NADP octopine/nopaline dehydrogenase family protein [Tepidisphaeraceae bacterium]